MNTKGHTDEIFPEKSSVFTLREAFTYTKINNMLLGGSYKLTTDPEVNKIHPNLLCSQSTFYRRFK